MKRGFTLIELMIVIAVLVTLMAITFRIANTVSDTEARTITITRMQRLENCLSGFHAAFGCYPPVKLHGNRSFKDQEESINWGNESEAWRWVEQVCRAQPVGCRFPFDGGYNQMAISEYIRMLSDAMAEAASSGEYDGKDQAFETQNAKDWAAAGFSTAGDAGIVDMLKRKKDKVLWDDLKLFQYGVMSYLLPRYFVMMGGNREFFTDGYAQWTANNENPSDPFTGEELSWASIYDWLEEYRGNNNKKSENTAKLLMIPSQAVCARWLPNLEGICRCNKEELVLFGVNIKSPKGDIDFSILGSKQALDINFLVPQLLSETRRPDGDGSYRDQYILDVVTVNDGWGSEFYYYSRAPYQSYTLWSAGPNRKTFPPWIARDRLSGQELDIAAKWTKDDIMHMSN